MNTITSRKLRGMGFLIVPLVAVSIAAQAQDGIVTTHILDNDYARRGDILPDGRLILGGHCNDGIFCTAVYSPNGVLDTTMTYDVGGDNWGGYAGATATPDNKIVLAGYKFVYGRKGYTGSFVLLRYHADGKLDKSFNRGKLVTANFGKNTDAIQTRVLVPPDNSVIGLGWFFDNKTPKKIALMKFTEAGKLDSSFGFDGQVIDTVDRSGLEVNAGAMQGDKILVGAKSRSIPHISGLEDNNHLLVSRFNSDGSRDMSFGVDGDAIIDIDPVSNYNYEAVHRLAVQPDGKILVAGVYENNCVIARLTPDGNLDLGFGVGGIVIQDFFPDFGQWGDIEVIQREYTHGIAPLPDGRIAVAATLNIETGPNNSDVLKYTSVLSIYDQYGNLEAWTQGPDGSPREIKLDSQGGIVLMGIVNLPGEYDFWMTRYLVDEEGIFPDLMFGLE